MLHTRSRVELVHFYKGMEIEKYGCSSAKYGHLSAIRFRVMQIEIYLTYEERLKECGLTTPVETWGFEGDQIEKCLRY